VLEQELLGLQRIGGVRRIDHDRLAPEVRKGGDVGLNEELVHTAVAARDDHDVFLGDLDHGDRIVERRMRDLEFSGDEPVALALRAFGVLLLDREAVFGEHALGDADIDRQGLGVGKRIDAQLRRLRAARRGAGHRKRAEHCSGAQRRH